MSLSAMRLQAFSNAKGFSLVEVLVSASILGYALSVILFSYIHNMELTNVSRNLTTAIIHAEYVMEDMRNTAFGSIASSSWDTATITSKGLQALKDESITIDVTGTNPKEVVVTVAWTDFKQRLQTRSLKTLISG